MRSLFLRIFLWSWLVMALVAAVLVLTSPLFTRSRPGLDRWHQGAEEWARGRASRVATHVEEVGIGNLPPGRGRGRGRGGPPSTPAKVFILDEDGRELQGEGNLPLEAREIARRVLSTNLETSERTGMLYLHAHPVTEPSGRRVVVVAAHHNPPRLVHLLDPKALAWRLGILLLVVGGLSFSLARYLSSPVGPLRRATRRLSGGDLSARVEGRVTSRRDEIGELARDFDAMAERIEGLVGTQQRLLRDVSHELRSPLARLVVALELARSRAGEDAARPLDRIEREAARLDELIGRLLLLARVEAGSAGGDGVKLDLAAIVAEVVADAGFEAGADDREVRFASTEPIVFKGRADLLRSAFDNVVRNAVRHTPAGTAVEVACLRNDDGIEVTVRDHGTGVAGDEVERIFEPFYRVDQARDRATGGVGLGLAIAARAVRAHGGSIGAENHPEGGLVVRMWLPIVENEK